MSSDLVNFECPISKMIFHIPYIAHRIHGDAIYGAPWIPSRKNPINVSMNIPAPWILYGYGKITEHPNPRRNFSDVENLCEKYESDYSLKLPLTSANRARSADRPKTLMGSWAENHLQVGGVPLPNIIHPRIMLFILSLLRLPHGCCLVIKTYDAYLRRKREY